jgi:hypothetical protein
MRPSQKEAVCIGCGGAITLFGQEGVIGAWVHKDLKDNYQDKHWADPEILIANVTLDNHDYPQPI